MHPLYSPVVNYNTEFPQLGSSHRRQISTDRQPQTISPHLHGVGQLHSHFLQLDMVFQKA